METNDEICWQYDPNNSTPLDSTVLEDCDCDNCRRGRGQQVNPDGDREMPTLRRPRRRLSRDLPRVNENGLPSLTRNIALDCYGINIDLTQRVFEGEADEEPPLSEDEITATIDFYERELKRRCPHCEQYNCFFDCQESRDALERDQEAAVKEVAARHQQNGAIEGLMATILAHATVGVNIRTPDFQHGVRQAIRKIREMYGDQSDE
jgi:hypothetical protein